MRTTYVKNSKPPNIITLGDIIGVSLTTETPNSGSQPLLSTIIKTAADDSKMSKYYGKIERKPDGSVDLIAEMKKHQNALWIKVKAIEADIPNDNGDYFSREELLKSYKSFEGVPVFTNHENNKIEKAKGKVILAEWNDQENSVYCTMFVDREAYGDICRLIESGIATDVSMGTQVDYSVCSFCKKRAKTEAEYCDHLKTMKGRLHEGKKVYEENYGLKFIEISIVTDGACKDCTIREIIDPDDILRQAQSNPMKAAASIGKFMTKIGRDLEIAMVKFGGQAEIQKLNEAMTKIEEVVRTMLDQKQYIDLEFVSNIVEVMKDLQHNIDELVDQGYGSVGNQPGMTPAGQISVPPMQESGGGVPQGPSPVETSSTGVAAVTEPVSAENSDRKILVSKRIKDLRESLEKIYGEAMSIHGGTRKVSQEKYKETIKKLASVWENPSVKEFKTEISDGKWRIIIGGEDVYGMLDGKKVASLQVSELEPDVQEMLNENPKMVGDYMLNALKTKVAEKAPTNTAEQIEQTQELQLETQKPPLHPREKEIRESITEKQLDEKHTGYDTHTRKDDPKETVTEKQLNDVPSDKFDRQGVDKKNEEITELQLRDNGIKGNTNPAGEKERASGVSDQKETITENQLRQWESAEKTHSPKHEITEKQLKDQGEPWGRRISSVEDAKKAMSAVKSAMAKTCIATKATPDEIMAIGLSIIENPVTTIKAMENFDKLASQKDERSSLLKRAAFHGTSLTNASGTYLLGSLADSGMCAEVAVKALRAFANSKEPLKAIAEQIKVEADALQPKQTVPQTDFFKEALNEDTEESVRVDLNVKEIDVAPESQDFTKAAFEAASRVASDHGIKVTKNISVEKDGTKVHVSVAGTKMTEEEQKVAKAESAKSRKEARKTVEAQMPAGGGMPGAAPAGGPMGGGGGTTMPTPMPGDPSAGAPVSSLAADPMAEEGLGDEEAGAGEAVPPGSICPVCGQDDVDVKSGEFQCNNCGAEGEMSFVVKVHTFPGVIEEKGPSSKKEEGLGDEIADEGGIGDMAGGPGAAMPPVGGPAGGIGGIAASFKITPEMVKQSENKPIGHVCPHCGVNGVKLAFKNGTGIGRCHDCKKPYRVDVSVDSEKNLEARVAWKPSNITKVAKINNQQEKKACLLKALKEASLIEKFEAANFDEKASIIASLHDQGLL